MSDRAVRYVLDAEESLKLATRHAAVGNVDLSVAHATIATACAVLATVPAAVWRDAAVRRELEARGLVRRGQTLTDPGEARPPIRPVLVRDDERGTDGD